MDGKNEPPTAPPPPPGRDPTGRTTLVAVPLPKPDANAQKGFAAIGGITINYEDDTPDHIKKAAQHHLHMLIGWCKLRPHVTKNLPLQHNNKGKRKGRKRGRRWW